MSAIERFNCISEDIELVTSEKRYRYWRMMEGTHSSSDVVSVCFLSVYSHNAYYHIGFIPVLIPFTW